jgi:phage host-nuclease inhibitor protein Gam
MMVNIRIKENSPQAKAIIELLKTMSFVEFIDEKTPQEITLEAIKDAKKGKITKAKDTKDLFKKLNS